MRPRRGRTRDARRPDEGFSLVEVLVSMVLFASLGTLLLALAINAGDVTDTISTQGELTGESRVAIERMTRELRQAREIQEVKLATTDSPSVKIRFWADFDGDGVRDTGADDPEILSYEWDPVADTLTLSAPGSGRLPVLAARVTSFDLQLGSSLWEYAGTAATSSPSASASPSGGPTAPPPVTSWLDLDRAGAPVGNGNGVPDVELPYIDLVTLHLVAQADGLSQTYDFRANLRNQDQT